MLDDLAPPEVVREQGVTVVAPGPDYENIYENMLDNFNSLLDDASTIQPPLLVVDLAHTKLIGSAFLGFLLRLSNRVTGREGGRFGVCNLAPFCKAVFQTTRMEKLWDLFDSRAEAVAAFSTGEST